MADDLRALQLAELDMLKELLKVCAEHGLRVWVEGGTMLGAVRHKGFIPWDDDVDVQMPRTDYDRLVQEGGDWFKAPYFLQSAYSEPGYFRGHAQLRNDMTSAIRPSESYRKFNQGIFIDIFPLDHIPDDAKERDELGRSIHHRLRCLKAVDLDVLHSGRLLQVFRKARMRRMVRKRGFLNLYKAIEEDLRNVDTARCSRVGHFSFSRHCALFDPEIFHDTVWLDFEDIKVPVPAEYKRFLTTQFGPDYMTPRQAPSEHGDLVFSTSRSWREMAPEVARDWKKSAFKRAVNKLIGKK